MSIKSKVLQITAMAMDITNAGIAHVIVEYKGFVNVLAVHTYPSCTLYDENLNHRSRILDVMVQLDVNEFRTEEDVHNTLDSVIDKLKALKVKEQAV